MEQKYHYRFPESIPGEEIEGTFLLSLLAVESLHGRERLVRESRFTVDKPGRYCRVIGGTEVAQAIHRIFSGFARREFGDGAVNIEEEAV